jgi:hypothetical protein
VAVGTFRTTVAFALCEEAAQVRSVSLVVWVGAGELLEHVLCGRADAAGFDEGFVGRELYIRRYAYVIDSVVDGVIES